MLKARVRGRNKGAAAREVPRRPRDQHRCRLGPWQRMLMKERPHLTRCVEAAARGPDDPFWNRLAARPGEASSLDGIEHHRCAFSTVRAFEAGDILSDHRFDRARYATVSLRPTRH